MKGKKTKLFFFLRIIVLKVPPIIGVASVASTEDNTTDKYLLSTSWEIVSNIPLWPTVCNLDLSVASTGYYVQSPVLSNVRINHRWQSYTPPLTRSLNSLVACFLFHNIPIVCCSLNVNRKQLETIHIEQTNKFGMEPG